MSRNFLIAGTGPRVGKSIVACALGFAFRARGLRVGVMKPVETGCAERGGLLDPADTRGVALAAACDLPLDLICPYRYASAFPAPAAAEADGAPPPDMRHLLDCFRKIAQASDAVLVEDVGGLAAPITWSADSADLAAYLALELIVVVANRPGCLNSALVTLRYGAARGLRIAGYLLNDVVSSASASGPGEGLALARAAHVPCLGAMRYKEPLGLSVIEALLGKRG